MEELKQEIFILVDSIDNPKMLRNLKTVIIDYVDFVAKKQKNVKD